VVRPLFLLSALLLAGCGYKGPVTRLEPPDPALTREQQKAARAAESRAVREGLVIPAEARPIRIDEINVKLGIRAEDLFALPPEGTRNARTLPFPGDPDDLETDAPFQPELFTAPVAAPPATTPPAPQP
jgi:predicted small lipoprotein YifL